MSEWQPIETAPKDGSWFVICRIGEDDFFEVGRHQPMFWPEYIEEDDGRFRRETRKVFDWRGFNNMHRATHWMPLPDPPK